MCQEISAFFGVKGIVAKGGGDSEVYKLIPFIVAIKQNIGLNKFREMEDF